MLLGPLQRLVASSIGYTSLIARGTVTAARSLGVGPQTEVRPVARCLSSAADDVEAEVDVINEKFAEAREEIEFAREDAETVYFNESAEEARKAVTEVLDRWKGLLARVSENEQGKLQRSMGLKIEQLKAELKELDEMHA